jgi:uncharacterized protein (DUF2141 family)
MRLLSVCVAAGLLAAPVAIAADLTVQVKGARSDRGTIEYAVFDRAETFLDEEKAVARGEVAADMDTARFVVKGLKPGRYAVAVYHDENANGRFDQGFLGLPLEDYGFSNDATVFFSAPSFDAAAVTVGAGGATIIINLD